MTLKRSAEKEIKRMQKVFEQMKVKEGTDFFDFAKTYFEDGKYFYERKKYLEAFEAVVIAWSYVDFGLKLGWFEVPKGQRRWFTV